MEFYLIFQNKKSPYAYKPFPVGWHAAWKNGGVRKGERLLGWIQDFTEGVSDTDHHAAQIQRLFSVLCAINWFS